MELYGGRSNISKRRLMSVFIVLVAVYALELSYNNTMSLGSSQVQLRGKSFYIPSVVYCWPLVLLMFQYWPLRIPEWWLIRRRFPISSIVFCIFMDNSRATFLKFLYPLISGSSLQNTISILCTKSPMNMSALKPHSQTIKNESPHVPLPLCKLQVGQTLFISSWSQLN